MMSSASRDTEETSFFLTDVTSAILSRHLVAQIHCAIKLQRAIAELHTATVSHEQTRQLKQTWPLRLW